MSADPFVPRRLPRMDPNEEYQRMQRTTPEPATIHLSPRERAALAAYRAQRDAARQARDHQATDDPMTRTWMP